MTCPVIVRLIQVSYPRMAEQLLQMQPPREIAGREIKRRYSRELGLPPEQIAAIYVTPCQARTISIVQPAEGGRSSSRRHRRHPAGLQRRSSPRRGGPPDAGEQPPGPTLGALVGHAALGDAARAFPTPCDATATSRSRACPT